MKVAVHSFIPSFCPESTKATATVNSEQ